MPERRSGLVGPVLLVLAGLGACGAAAAPWDTLSSDGETRTFTGLEVGDGRLSALLGLGLVVLGGAGLARRPRSWHDGRVAAALGLVLTLLAAGDLLGGPPALASFRRLSADRIAVRPGAGLAATAAAGVVAIVGALMVLAASRRSAGRRDGRGDERWDEPGEIPDGVTP